MNLLDAIAAAVPPVEPAVRPRRLMRAVPSDAAPAPLPVSKPVLQFGPMPLVLDLKKYATRSDGDLRPLAAFRDLVDPLPSFTPFYATSGMSTEKLYESIIKGARCDIDSFAQSLLDAARLQFDTDTFTNMDGTPGRWRPVYATPDDWYDVSINGRFQDLSVDLRDQGGKGSAYATIGDPAPLGLSADGRAPNRTSPDPGTTIHSFRMKYLLVSFRRPWLHNELFHSGGWSLSKQSKGWCSSGELQANSGVFPLLPTAMLLGKDVALDATWGQTDQGLLASAARSNAQISFGPFRLNLSAAPASDVQIVAWTSSLTPRSPQQSDLPDS